MSTVKILISPADIPVVLIYKHFPSCKPSMSGFFFLMKASEVVGRPRRDVIVNY